MLTESGIVHESADHQYWVLRRISKRAEIAPVGSVYYQIFKAGVTHSTATTFITASLDRAIATCNRMAQTDATNTLG